MDDHHTLPKRGYNHYHVVACDARASLSVSKPRRTAFGHFAIDRRDNGAHSVMPYHSRHRPFYGCKTMNQGSNDRDLISVAETARLLQRSTEQVRRYLREGRLPGRRMGGQWFIERSAVTGFASNSRKEDRFTQGLKPARRSRPFDDVIGIGEGPGSNISDGKLTYRTAGQRRR